jgi:hypothetical protein
MSLLLYGALAVVVLGGGGLGAWAYVNIQRQQPDDADADAEAADGTDADTEETDGLDIDRPEPEFSQLGAVAAGAISLIPDPEHGVRESARALIDRPQTEYSRLGGLAAKLISVIPKPLFGVRETLFKRLAVKSIENYHKTAGGDAIGINAQAGQQIDLEPIKYRPPESCEEGEQPGWVAKSRDKTWNPAEEGNSVNYLGRTPLVALEDDSHVEAGWLAPRIGEAIEMDNYWPLFSDPQITAHIDMRTGAGGRTNGAIADGGTSTVNFELEQMGEYADDAIVDLGSGPEYDGLRISMSKAREWQAETADSEEMQMQEDRGYLRGLANGDDGPSLTKLLLICAAIILGVLAIVFLGPQLMSGGGGGGGGINPLMAFGGL